jgi:hypothetical protein
MRRGDLAPDRRDRDDPSPAGAQVWKGGQRREHHAPEHHREGVLEVLDPHRPERTGLDDPRVRDEHVE